MKNLLIFIVLISAIGCSRHSAEDERLAIRIMLDEQVTNWNAGSVDGFMKGYWNDSNMQFISKKGVRRGWQQTLNAYKKHYPTADSMGTLRFHLDTIEFLDTECKMGHVMGRWELIRASDTPNGYFSLLTRKMSDGPKIIIDHTW